MLDKKVICLYVLYPRLVKHVGFVIFVSWLLAILDKVAIILSQKIKP